MTNQSRKRAVQSRKKQRIRLVIRPEAGKVARIIEATGDILDYKEEFSNNGYARIKYTNKLGRRVNKRVHRMVWEHVNGKIPKGYIIHHIDENKKNNSISNLQIMKKKDHDRLHGSVAPRDSRGRFVKKK